MYALLLFSLNRYRIKGIRALDYNQFQEWLSGVDGLSQAQRQQLQGVLLGESEAGASLEAKEVRLAENRQCLHCDTPGAIGYDAIQGLQEDLQPRFSSLSLIPASFGRCFHAISIR